MSETDAAWRGACTDHLARRVDPAEPHASWDLDVGDCSSWLRALDICANHCPALKLCQAQRRTLFAYHYPVGVIWAGVPYGETGQPLDTAGLRQLAATLQRQSDPHPYPHPGPSHAQRAG